MSEQLTQPNEKKSALAVMAERCNVEANAIHKTLKETCFKGATDSEMLALVVVANNYGLNPFLKELYAFPAKGGGIVPVVGIDGWLAIINRQPNFDGMTVEVLPPDGTPTHAVCSIFLKDRSHPVSVTEYYAECQRGTDPWKTMPRRMLRHKAIMQAARIAFGISGITDEDEASDTLRNAKAEREKPKFRAKEETTIDAEIVEKGEAEHE